MLRVRPWRAKERLIICWSSTELHRGLRGLHGQSRRQSHLLYSSRQGRWASAHEVVRRIGQLTETTSHRTHVIGDALRQLLEKEAAHEGVWPFHFGLVVTPVSRDKTARAAVSTDRILGMNNSSDLGFSACT